MSATSRFHEVANDALVKISNNLWPEAKLALVIYTPGEPGKDIVLKDQGIVLDEVISTLRRGGLSIDGDNAYKRDLLDATVGAMAMGVQNNNPPPTGHWGQRFWDIGRAERALTEELVEVLKGVQKRCEGMGYVGVDGQYLKVVQAAIAKANH
ncbi:hypothetical protein [Pseudomonas fontis]|uniref:Uncharacterized protein n=1 Tax=Pseudomonas fontis TaxID=2942633 RepID=A0ABT5P1S6_9PSED|nr:hypothetical protein [Pseudomonas fontis]MDD0975939.1 hypothetical protein [Pseudomonas fontis]MDD0994249.1 hypothetical protein [Pseudomonas fontis]